MKKLIGFILAVIMFSLFVFIYNNHLESNLQKKVDVFRQGNAYTTLEVPAVMKEILKNNSMLILGSSEFNPNWQIGQDAFPTLFFNGEGYDLDVVIAGRGGTQSLNHAITIAAYGDEIANKKVTLIVSPQWFAPGGVSEKAFSGVFLPEIYQKWMNNNTLSHKTTKAIQKRTEELLKNMDGKAWDRVNAMNHSQKTEKPVTGITRRIENAFMELKKKYEFDKKHKEEKYIEKTKTADDIDFKAMLNDAETMGKKYSTNNEFGIYDSYFNTYIRQGLKGYRNKDAGYSYAKSKEYDDLKLFLEVCKEKGVKPMLVIVPVNGRWYDYIGHQKSERQKYYENIRNVAKEYGAEIADFSGKEYETYFLADVMHIGWKGWVYLDESIYKFSKEK